MNLRAAGYVVLRRVDMAAGMQAHMHAPHDLAGAPGCVVLLEDLHLELHVRLESRRRAHRIIFWIELEADIDDGLIGKRHGASLLVGRLRLVDQCPTGLCAAAIRVPNRHPIGSSERFDKDRGRAWFGARAARKPFPRRPTTITSLSQLPADSPL